MKKFLLGTAALFALAAPAAAADLGARYTKAPPIASPIYNWTGFYIGGHIGVGFNGNDNNFFGATGNNTSARFLGGGQAGRNFSSSGLACTNTTSASPRLPMSSACPVPSATTRT